MKQIVRLSALFVMLLTACGGTPSEAVVRTPTATQPGPATAPTETVQPTTTLVPTTAPPTGTLAPSATPPTETTATTEAPTSTSAATATASATATAAGATITATVGGVTATAAATPTGGTTGPAGTIAYVRGNTIYAYRLQTGENTVLIEEGRDPQFSRDGAQLAFVRDDGLYLAGADGSNVRHIARQPNVAAPRWADDGTKIAFEQAGTIWTIELPNGTPLKIANGSEPAWAPDGKRIAYVTAIPDSSGGIPRRNQLRLTNWRGQNSWSVVRDIAANTPPIGIPGNQLPPAQLEHLLFTPVWSADGSAIFVPAFVTTQVETDFTILERADPVNGGSTFVQELPGVGAGFGSPDRTAIVFTVPTARGDVGLIARTIAAQPQPIAWATSQQIAVHQSPAWSPDSQALASFSCPLDQPDRCDLVLFAPNQKSPQVLIADVFGGQGLDFQRPQTIAWGR